jgi:hypothetical protein
VANVESTTGPLTINLPNSGNPTVNLSPGANLLDNLPGRVTVKGSGFGTVNVDDQAGSANNCYVLTASSFTRPNFGGLNYSGIANLNINACPGNSLGNYQSTQNIYVLGTAAGVTTTIDATNGWHDISVGLPTDPKINTTGLPPSPLENIQGPVTIKGQGSRDVINLWDWDSSTAQKTYAINSTNIAVTSVNGVSVANPVPISWQGNISVVALFGSAAVDTYQFQSLPAGLAAIVVDGYYRANTFQSLLTERRTWAIYANTAVGSFIPGECAIDLAEVYNFIGGPSGDDFAFAPNWGVNGKLDGVLNGNGGTLDYSQDTSPITVNLANDSATNIDGGAAGGFASIRSVIGNNTNTTVVGPDSANFWNITGPNQGNLAQAPHQIGTFTFRQVPNLTGGSATDDFVFGPTGSINGFLSGGDFSTRNNTLDLSAYTSPLTVHVGSSIYGGTVAGVVHAFALCPNVIGGQGDDRFIIDQGYGLTTLDGGPGNNTLDLSHYSYGPQVIGILQANAGYVSGEIAGFSNIQNLVTGPTNDTFALRGTGHLDGTIDGGGGLNTLNYTQSAASVSVNLQTGAASYVDLRGGAVPQPGGITHIQSFVGGPGSANTLIGSDTPNAWTLAGINRGTVNGSTFAGFQNLTGGAASDVFRLRTGGGLSVRLNGGAGTNTLDYSPYVGNVTVGLPLGVATGLAGGIAKIQDVTGSQGNDLLVGDAHANVFVGGTGRNVLIGGAGSDTLNASGASGDNLVIGGTTAYDANLAALEAILAEWTRTDLGFRDRYSDLTSGRNGAGARPLNQVNGQLILLTTATVHADSAPDTLIGSSRTDPATGRRVHNWFFYDLDDVVVNFLSSSDQETRVR